MPMCCGRGCVKQPPRLPADFSFVHRMPSFRHEWTTIRHRNAQLCCRQNGISSPCLLRFLPALVALYPKQSINEDHCLCLAEPKLRRIESRRP